MSRKEMPSLDEWMREAKADPAAADCGMFLFHNGTVRRTAKARVRMNDESSLPVTGMEFSYDPAGVNSAIEAAYKLPGVYYIRVWLNEGELTVGDDIMLVLVGGDIRPHVIDALQQLVGEIKNNCVVEKEKY
ncbi:MAG: molybdenum cofactor biosynthesis protein MoaE [Candidatus Limivicinus sp.]|nr:molybdenum cofactor biosynthesis protein MoaE [Clostridiales bacterium]MDY3859435.1 molybdenum cofactor biosynthesis protein MoaE [Candidatus Limivicinus sp.]